MANVKFAYGTNSSLTTSTTGFDDGCIYFNTSNKNIYLRLGSSIYTFKGTDTDTNTDTKVTTATTTSKFYLTGQTASTGTTGSLVFRTNAYVDTSGYLYSGGSKVLTSVPKAGSSTYGGAKIYTSGTTCYIVTT